MTIWPPAREDLTHPAFRSLARKMAEAIGAGALPVGTKLPTHRALAYELGLSVQTVSRAYGELVRQGLISGEIGRGTYVRGRRGDAQIPWYRAPSAGGIIDCSLMVPVHGELHQRKLSETLIAMARDVPREALFTFRPRAILEPHLEPAARWLAGCGLRVRPEQIVPTAGSTTAMTLALQTAAEQGDLVVTETAGHHTLKSLTATLGLNLVGLAMDAEGILPDAFERACKTSSVRVLFTMPAGIGPTCAVMGERRRKALIDIAERFDVRIIEDDAWGPMDPERIPPMAAMAPDRVLYFTGLTKCVLPALRLGWLVVPEAMISAARTRHLVTNWMAPPLMVDMASRWISDGTARTLMQWQRKQLSVRNRIAAARLGTIPFRATPSGFHIWLPLPEGWTEEAFVEHARHEGVAVAAGSSFRTGNGPHVEGIRICLGAGSEQDIAQGVGVIARLARSHPEPTLPAL